VTTVHTQEVTCGLCGTTQAVTAVGSTNAFGSMDLGARPPQMRRSTVSHWLHECKDCGLVAGNLSVARASDAHIVASTAYRAELNHAGRPRLANVFVCGALLEEAGGDLVMAARRRLHSAWACDDATHTETARVQRLEGLALFEPARAEGQHAMKSMAGGEEMLLADSARRAGEFERALSYCTGGLAAPGVTELTRQLLLFERELVLRRDAGR